MLDISVNYLYKIINKNNNNKITKNNNHEQDKKDGLLAGECIKGKTN